MLYSTYLAAGWLLKEERHVRITVITERLGARASAVMTFAGAVIGLGACALLAWQSGALAWSKLAAGTIVPRPIPVPEGILVASFTLGMVFLTIYLFESAISMAKRAWAAKPPLG